MSSLRASDGYGYYAGIQTGFVGLQKNTGSAYGNALGFGVDLGVRTNSVMDVVFSSQYSKHNALKLFSETLEANFYMWQMNDLEFSIGAGPGFYILNSGVSSTEFGLQGSLALDVVATDALRLGVGYRYHGIFGTADDYWTVMMRVGFIFGDE